jgi:sec-independent protein translocase protein TatA
MALLFGFFEGLLAPSHILILLIIGILVFGKRLPEVGRSLGKGIVEFKKGMQGLEDEVQSVSTRPAAQLPAEPLRPPQRVTPTAPTAPKFQETLSEPEVGRSA